MSFGLRRLGVNFGRLGSMPHRGASTPSWLPLADGTAPKVYADFAAQNYWYNGATVADWAAFLTALSGTLDGSSSRYYTNVAGTLVATTGPRFDYDPVTHVARGILLEGARTSLFLRSNDFGNASWSKNSITSVVQDVVSPTGLTDGWTVTANGGGTTILFQSMGQASGFTFSVYAKAGTSSFLFLRTDDGGGQKRSWFNLATGVLGTQNSSVSSSTFSHINPAFVAVGGGWYRASITTSGSGTNSTTCIGFSAADNSLAMTAGNTVLVSNSGYEAGAFASSYIPTTSGSVTRAADSLVFTPISGWFNATTGTILCVWDAVGGYPSVSYAASLNNNDVADNAFNMLPNNGGVSESRGWSAGANIFQLSLTRPPIGATGKQSLAYALNDFAGNINGGAVGADSSGILPTGVDRLMVGSSGGGNSSTFGHIKQFGYWNTRVSNAGLQALTT